MLQLNLEKKLDNLGIMESSNQPRRLLHKLKYKMTAISNYYKVLIIWIFVIVLLLIYNYCLLMTSDNLRNELKAANMTSKEFALALKEYKKIMELRPKADEEPKLSVDFVKLVQKFKETASQDLLEQLYQVENPIENSN